MPFVCFVVRGVLPWVFKTGLFLAIQAPHLPLVVAGAGHGLVGNNLFQVLDISRGKVEPQGPQGFVQLLARLIISAMVPTVSPMGT